MVLADKPQDAANAGNEESPAIRKETSENPKNAVVYMNPANAIVFKLNQQQPKAGALSQTRPEDTSNSESPLLRNRKAQ